MVFIIILSYDAIALIVCAAKCFNIFINSPRSNASKTPIYAIHKGLIDFTNKIEAQVQIKGFNFKPDSIYNIFLDCNDEFKNIMQGIALNGEEKTNKKKTKELKITRVGILLRSCRQIMSQRAASNNKITFSCIMTLLFLRLGASTTMLQFLTDLGLCIPWREAEQMLFHYFFQLPRHTVANEEGLISSWDNVDEEVGKKFHSKYDLNRASKLCHSTCGWCKINPLFHEFSKKKKKQFSSPY